MRCWSLSILLSCWDVTALLLPLSDDCSVWNPHTECRDSESDVTTRYELTSARIQLRPINANARDAQWKSYFVKRMTCPWFQRSSLRVSVMHILQHDHWLTQTHTIILVRHELWNDLCQNLNYWSHHLSEKCRKFALESKRQSYVMDSVWVETRVERIVRWRDSDLIDFSRHVSFKILKKL